MPTTTVFNSSLYAIEFIKPGAKAPPALVAEGTLRFKGGMLDGFELRGFNVWQNGPGKPINVTMPARNYMAGGVKRNWDLLRPAGQLGSEMTEADKLKLGALQDTIRNAYHYWTSKQNTPAAYTPTAGQAFSEAVQDLVTAPGLPLTEDF